MRAVDKFGNELLVGDRVAHGARSGNTGKIQIATIEKIEAPNIKTNPFAVTIKGDENIRSGIVHAYSNWQDDTSTDYVCGNLIKLFKDYQK